MNKFAPGPWKITCAKLTGYRISDSDGWGVAVVLKDVDDKDNAQLIAAAPMMLEVLERALKDTDKIDVVCEMARVHPFTLMRADIAAAIRAAKGE